MYLCLVQLFCNILLYNCNAFLAFKKTKNIFYTAILSLGTLFIKNLQFTLFLLNNTTQVVLKFKINVFLFVSQYSTAEAMT